MGCSDRLYSRLLCYLDLYLWERSLYQNCFSLMTGGETFTSIATMLCFINSTLPSQMGPPRWNLFPMWDWESWRSDWQRKWNTPCSCSLGHTFIFPIDNTTALCTNFYWVSNYYPYYKWKDNASVNSKPTHYTPPPPGTCGIFDNLALPEPGHLPAKVSKYPHINPPLFPLKKDLVIVYDKKEYCRCNNKCVYKWKWSSQLWSMWCTGVYELPVRVVLADSCPLQSIWQEAGNPVN